MLFINLIEEDGTLSLKVAVKHWRAPQTATHTYYIMQSSLCTCFKTACAKKEEPKAKFNSKAKSVRAENCSCAQNSRKIFETYRIVVAG